MASRPHKFTHLLHSLCLACACLLPSHSIAGGYDDFDSDVTLDAPASQDYETEFAEPSSLSSYYVGVNGGYAMPTKYRQFLNSGYSVGAQVGYRDANYRTSIILGYERLGFKGNTAPPGASYNLSTAMVTVFYDFNYAGRIVPFLGAGAGYLYRWKKHCLEANPNCNDLGQGSKFAYQLIGGIGLQYKHVRFDVRYRYFSFLKPNGYGDNIIEGVFNYFFEDQ